MSGCKLSAYHLERLLPSVKFWGVVIIIPKQKIQIAFQKRIF